MKNKIFKSLIVGLCCSFLFSTGSFASSQKNNDVSVKENLNLPSISLIDSLLFQKSESNGECCNTASVIIRLGDNFGERAGYYKLDLQLTFLTLYGREIKETTYPEV